MPNTPNQPKAGPEPTGPIHVHVRLGPRLLADLALALDTEGVPHRGSYAHLVRLVLSAAHRGWECTHFQTDEEALVFLAQEGFSAGPSPAVLRTLQRDALSPAGEAQQAARKARAAELAEWLAKQPEAPE